MKDFVDNCGAVENSLPLYVGGDLEAPILSLVHRHLGRCAACAAKADLARGAHRALVAGLSAERSECPELWSGVRATLVSERLIDPSLRRDAARPARQPAREMPAREMSVAKVAGRGSLALAPERARRSWLPLGVAAAAVLLAIWILRMSGPGAASVDGPHERPIVEMPVDGLVDAQPREKRALEVVPVSHGLRRLAPGEESFSDTAVNYGWEESSIETFRRGNSSLGSPASLQRVGGIR